MEVAVEAPPRERRSDIDPRFSARRVAVQRDAGRKRLRRLTWAGGVVLLAVGAAGLTRTPLLDLDTIDVQGATASLTADQVRAVAADAGLRPGTPLLDIDAGAAEAALEALPGVEDAHVTRHWPGAVTIDLVERVPVAAVALASGSTALVGADGIVIAVEPAAPADMVVVDGPPALEAGERVEAPALLAVAAGLPEGIRARITGVGQDSGGGVELRLAPGGVIRLGSADQLAEKLVAVETMLTQADTDCVAIIDVQVPSAPTVNRRPECG